MAVIRYHLVDLHGVHVGNRWIVDAVSEVPTRGMIIGDTVYVKDDQTFYVATSESATTAVNTIQSPLTVQAASNAQLILKDTTETAPAGNYRLLVNADNFTFSKARTGNFTTTDDYTVVDTTNRVFSHDAPAGDNWYIRLLAGSAVGNQSGLILGGSTAAVAGVELRTGNGAGSNLVRFTIGIGAATVTFTISNANLSVATVQGLQVLQGDGAGTLTIRPNVSTDATARRTALTTLDPATDTFTTVAQAVPNAANPFFTIFAPDVAPTTSILDTNNIGLRYTPAGAVVLYVNDAGVIKSLSLGTPA